MRPLVLAAALVMYLVYVVRGGSVLHLHLNGDKLTEADVARTASKATGRLEAAVG